MTYRASLDWLNFLLADVRGGLRPYVSVFLLTEAHWDQATMGAVLTVSGMIGITLHTPVGALIDITRRKRALLVAGVVALIHIGAVDRLGPHHAGCAGSRHCNGCARRGFRTNSRRHHARTCRTPPHPRSIRAERLFRSFGESRDRGNRRRRRNRPFAA